MAQIINDGAEFEDRVRRIARARWPQAEFSGAELINGRERDGVFETEDCIHFIEATISRLLEKVKSDSKKLFELIKHQQKANSMKGSRGWVITKHEPTAEQKNAVDSIGNRQITICSLDNFQRALVDVHSYLTSRENHFFGSVVDPENESLKPIVDYIPLDIIDPIDNEILSISEISSNLLTGKTYILQGDYGAGKSMTLRQIFFNLKKIFTSGDSSKFPIYINLREHSGQDDPSELIERHARRVGFSSPASLVRAWRAGFCIVLIDGYDEITTLGTSKRLALKVIRRDSLTAVRRLIEQSPANTGWIIAGREHFFDSPKERRDALGLKSNTKTLSLNEFSENQIRLYLEKLGASASTSLPSWLPTRPLFVGYMAGRGLLGELAENISLNDPVEGWDFLIDKICEREARIATGLDAATLRSILERLATIARSTQDGLGPISQVQIRETFLDICDYEPDDQANLILQRMPGLGVHRVEEDTRSFIDAELAEVCRGRDIVDFVLDPYTRLHNTGWRKSISENSNYSGNLAIARSARDLKRNNIRQGHFDAAFQSLQNIDSLESVKADLVGLCLALNFTPPAETIITGIEYFDCAMRFDSETSSISSVTFNECFFDILEIDPTADINKHPNFTSCAFSEIHGRSSRQDLPTGKFNQNCVYEKFSSSALTQSSILETDLSKGEKIILSLLRKLFIQSLGGRAESALSRGLDLNDRQRVAPALRLLQQHGFATVFNRGDGDVWLPNRKRLHSVRQLLAAPSVSSEYILKESRIL